jgi:hypothetical protein
MHFTHLLTFAATTMAAALPAAAPDAKPAPFAVGADDVVLHGNGRIEVMKRSEFRKRFPDSGVMPPTPLHLDPDWITLSGPELANLTSSHLSKRDVSVVIPGPTTQFEGWDVQVSQIVKGGPGVKVTVSAGFSISNSIAVKVGVDMTLIKNYLSTSMDVTRTWETSNSLTQTFFVDVPDNKYGAWVYRPLTTRRSGTVWSGKVGSAGSSEAWQADSFTPKSYGEMAWVDGYFVACFQDKFPMPRCQGGGFL